MKLAKVMLAWAISLSAVASCQDDRGAPASSNGGVDSGGGRDAGPDTSATGAGGESPDASREDVSIAPDASREDVFAADAAAADTTADAAGEDTSVGVDASPCTGPPPALALTRIAASFHLPTCIAAPPGAAASLYVCEKWSKLTYVSGDVRTTFLDLDGQVFGGGEAGVLGLAFHPRFGQGTEQRFYVYYTRLPDWATVVSEFKATSSSSADKASERPLVVVGQPSDQHRGGPIAFGPDGFLYIGMGDGGPNDDDFGWGQMSTEQHASILRIDVDRYPVPPAGNLVGGHPDVLHIGVRNPWRISFDRVTGDLYVADVGRNIFEEINIAPRGSGPLNFGWSTTEGNQCRRGGCDAAGLVGPASGFTHPGNVRSAIVGGYVYRGTRIPGLVGRYLYGDFGRNRIWTMRWTGSSVCDEHELSSDLDPSSQLDAISTFGEDSAGELYVASHNDGVIYRIDPE
jgi:glucose/arabinose dehydrogenase